LYKSPEGWVRGDVCKTAKSEIQAAKPLVRRVVWGAHRRLRTRWLRLLEGLCSLSRRTR
jgi:hypothetical protein